MPLPVGVARRRPRMPVGNRRRAVLPCPRWVTPIMVFVHELHDLDGIQIIDWLRFVVISNGRIVPGEAQNILDAEHGGAHEIRLHRNTIPVTAGHLHDWIMAGFIEEAAEGERPGTQHCDRVVLPIDPVHAPRPRLGLPQDP